MSDGFEHQLRADAERVEAYLAGIVADDQRGRGSVPERLSDAMRLAVLGGGKRFRPFLVMESAALFGVARDAALPAAAALELLHCYSLVHDDLPSMDNDTLRRGQPTVWSAYDEWTAILAGDALLTLAFEIMLDPTCHGDAGTRAELTRELAVASGRAGMVGGQCLDLQSDKLGDPAEPDIDYIRKMQSMKTGALLRFASEAGAILGQAAPGEREALRTFGDRIGFSFQIADDLLDIEGTPDSVGKQTGKDADAGKATLVSLMGVDRARAVLQETERQACDALELFGDRAGTLRDAARFVTTRNR